MFTKIKEFFFGKPKEVEPATEAPYKVEAPVVTPVVVPEPASVKPKPVKARKAPVKKPAAIKAAPKPKAKKST